MYVGSSIAQAMNPKLLTGGNKVNSRKSCLLFLKVHEKDDLREQKIFSAIAVLPWPKVSNKTAPIDQWNQRGNDLIFRTQHERSASGLVVN
jgi:hypothetical protein